MVALYSSNILIPAVAPKNRGTLSVSKSKNLKNIAAYSMNTYSILFEPKLPSRTFLKILSSSCKQGRNLSPIMSGSEEKSSIPKGS